MRTLNKRERAVLARGEQITAAQIAKDVAAVKRRAAALAKRIQKRIRDKS